ncbi:ABC-type nitrate/sulfonate/bicarbonate transport system, permease component [uncultured Microbacterium sp.]|uniref:ABC-type nitrate/sulfonate/bicarbonate transport system, permease component n=1 Tax=uncultured Microbacterium sp. TaxID=191216 RepID=A0A1Y5P799_9MICO|nr:ABC-type nitrate/sulfonate/bicarbonate transport system, permease component [uncultured Microbacterium sp.]
MTTLTAPKAAGRTRSAALRGPALGAIGVVGFLVLWELASRIGLIDPRFFPPASDVLVRLGEYLLDRAFWRDVAATMWAWFLGLSIAVISGAVLGFIIGSSRFLERATQSTIEFLRPIPSVAIIPLAVLLFGTKIQSELLLIVYASIWQVLLQVIYGTKDVDPVADATARSYGLSRWQRIRHVVWPTTLPYLMTGIRLAASVALILAITAELIIQTPGLGKQIAETREGGAVTSMYALILATGFIGVLINLVMRVIERRVLRWHMSVRMELVG